MEAAGIDNMSQYFGKEVENNVSNLRGEENRTNNFSRWAMISMGLVRPRERPAQWMDKLRLQGNLWLKSGGKDSGEENSENEAEE